MRTKSAIREMYYHEGGSYEDVQMTREGEKRLEVFIKCDDEITEKLKDNPEYLKLYNECINALDAVHNESAAVHFVHGFKFGLRMGLEAANENEH